MNGIFIGIFLLLYIIASFIPEKTFPSGVKYRGAISFVLLIVNGIALFILNITHVGDYISMFSTSDLTMKDAILLLVFVMYIKEIADSIYDIVNG